MTTARCACGGMVTVEGALDDWTDQVLRHARDEQHSQWSAEQEVDLATTIIHVPVRTPWSPPAAVRRGSGARWPASTSIERVA